MCPTRGSEVAPTRVWSAGIGNYLLFVFVDLLWFFLSNLESSVTSEFSIPYSRNSRVDVSKYV